ncbi:hypothetical protein FOL47_001906 [Perkinsus chesapeaki]|uniref:Uncharacterized protein n=1 Tax=Perkinsus chesapeaki TaxID=330153 RepID=A0A7J6MGP4_PERCH|nr:hypothetical protein FOL47_001906 [Perkinsus chesapeaki]
MSITSHLTIELIQDIWPLVIGFLTTPEAYSLAATTPAMWHLLDHCCSFSWRVKCCRLYTEEVCLDYLRSCYPVLPPTEEWRVWQRLASAWSDRGTLEALLTEPHRILTLPRDTRMISYGRESLWWSAPNCGINRINVSTGGLKKYQHSSHHWTDTFADDMAVVFGDGKLALMSSDGKPVAEAELPFNGQRPNGAWNYYDLYVDMAASVVYALQGMFVTGYLVDSARRSLEYLYTYELDLDDPDISNGSGHCVVFHDNQSHVLVYHALTGNLLLDFARPGEGVECFDSSSGRVEELSMACGPGEEWHGYRSFLDEVRIDPINVGQYLVRALRTRFSPRTHLLLSRRAQDSGFLETVGVYKLEKGYTSDEFKYQHDGRVIEVLVSRKRSGWETGICHVFDRVVWLRAKDLSPLRVFRNCVGFWRTPIRDAVAVVERINDEEGVVVHYWDLTCP